jgi:hypothetical protein
MIARTSFGGTSSRLAVRYGNLRCQLRVQTRVAASSASTTHRIGNLSGTVMTLALFDESDTAGTMQQTVTLQAGTMTRYQKFVEASGVPGLFDAEEEAQDAGLGVGAYPGRQSRVSIRCPMAIR